MISGNAQGYRDVAEAAWRWVLDQVRWDNGPWIPESAGIPEISEYRDTMYSGVGGLAYVMAEIRFARGWTTEERGVAEAIVKRLTGRIEDEIDCSLFGGLVSSIGVLTALEVPGAQAAVDRLIALRTRDGWPQTAIGPPGFLSDALVNDATLGTAGILLGALWARRAGLANAGDLGAQAADVLMADREQVPTGVNWHWVPHRFHAEPARQMPNFSHGLAGIAASLALAGTELDRPDLTGAAALGAEHLVTLGHTGGGGFVVPRTIPSKPGQDVYTYNWCHGPAGTSLLFLALDLAGVEDVAGEPPLAWHRRCLHSTRSSGLPARRHPGFWDNDGRCCGTTGVGEVFLDSWQRFGRTDDLEFAVHLADTLVERAVRDGPHAYWRFIEHLGPEPLLPPGVGWMQGSAGIAAFLFRISRVLRDGRDATPVTRMDSWWALPTPSSSPDTGRGPRG
ncbi:lanthionine synthetase LanC family protein [Amycolatopsis speibonae]|uniref:Lanthionine synthetase LanC family protein n=1 Tax=Amycolatopsis speibonae TaxID=1450224 RepID=A0ABV7NYB9_9PSEU